jgi:hypothetical protein
VTCKHKAKEKLTNQQALEKAEELKRQYDTEHIKARRCVPGKHWYVSRTIPKLEKP